MKDRDKRKADVMTEKCYLEIKDGLPETIDDLLDMIAEDKKASETSKLTDSVERGRQEIHSGIGQVVTDNDDFFETISEKIIDKDFYLTCRVCGCRNTTNGKACDACIKQYGDIYDLSTPDGRYAAKVEHRGILKRRSCFICHRATDGEKVCPKCMAKFGKRHDLSTNAGCIYARDEKSAEEVNKRVEDAKKSKQALADKLKRAAEALEKRDYHNVATSLKGVERLSKKLV